MIRITIAMLLFYSTVLVGSGIKEKTESIIRSEFGENVDVSFQKFIIPEYRRE
ncbi:MAG: hypothetical protein GXO87_03525 [Chlorobi bacterium]|nr:hypothetical protein [Chlorobiota bacterium]